MKKTKFKSFKKASKKIARKKITVKKAPVKKKSSKKTVVSSKQAKIAKSSHKAKYIKLKKKVTKPKPNGKSKAKSDAIPKPESKLKVKSKVQVPLKSKAKIFLKKSNKKVASSSKTGKKTAVKKTNASAPMQSNAKKARSRTTPPTKAPQKQLIVARTHSKVSEKNPSEKMNKNWPLTVRKRTQPLNAAGIIKNKFRKNPSIAFTLEDVRSVLLNRSSEANAPLVGAFANKFNQKSSSSSVKAKSNNPEVTVQNRTLGAASLTDILGYNPNGKVKPFQEEDFTKVPERLKKFYKKLLELRKHVKEGVDFHTKDTLKRSSKEDSGDLSSYSQHIADAGTDTFDRDFALSLLSNEQEALHEIEEAIHRIFDGTYGICEITNKPISTERLLAVPYTRYSLEGQREFEGNKRKTSSRMSGLFSDVSVEDASQYIEEDSSDT